MNIGKKHLTEGDFINLWTTIERELYKLFYDTTCSALVIYNNIYIICTSPNQKFVEDLYWKIGDFIYDRAREIRTIIFRSEDWIHEYNISFKKYKSYIGCLNELADFLNKYIRAKSLDQFSYLLWERCILQMTVKYKNTTLGEQLVSNCKIEYIKDAIDSLKCIVMDPKHPLLYYTQKYEQFALERIKYKYENEVPNLDMTILEYSNYVFEKISGERAQSEMLFLPESFEKLELILEDMLITVRKKFIQNELYKTLSQHKLPVEVLNSIRNSGSNSNNKPIDVSINMPFRNRQPQVHPVNDFYALFGSQKTDPQKLYTFSSVVLETVSKIFSNLSTIRNGYEILKSVLIKYINTELDTHFHLLDRRIETLYMFFCMFKYVVDVGFNGDKGCYEVFESKFSSTMRKLKPSLTARLIDFSNSIVSDDETVFEFFENQILIKHLKENDLEELKDKKKYKVINLKNLPKNDFYQNNNNSLPLITSDSSHKSSKCFSSSFDEKTISNFFASDNLYREGALFRVFYHLYKLIDDKNDFAERYLGDLAKRLVKGTTDIKKEQKLIDLIKLKSQSDALRKAEIMLNDIKLHYNTLGSKVLMLTQCAWPIEYNHCDIKIPVEFEEIIKNHTLKHPKKKINWIWEYSSMLIEIENKTLRVNFLQYLILILFNKYEKIDAEVINNETGIQGDVLKWTLLSLERSDVLDSDKGEYHISTKENKKHCYDYFVKEKSNDEHEINKLMYYQSTISRILKKDKELDFSVLYTLITEQHTDRFELDSTIIYNAIKTLMEKGVIEENKKVFYYVP